MNMLATSMVGQGATPKVPPAVPAAEDSSSAYYALASALAGMALLLVALVRI